MSAEKREFVRHPSSIPIDVRLLDGERGEVHMSDISLGGLAFAYHWPIALGVQVAVCVPSLASHIELSGRVVRCCGKISQWMVGVVFEEKEDVFRMRMVQQICHVEAYRQEVMTLENRSISSNEAADEWIATNAAHFPRCGL
ncbi:MAG: PilZ domain-containing protein [Mariprofundaceae bacterium]